MIRNLLSIIFILLFLPIYSWGATLYLEPIEGEYGPGDTFIVQVKIDTEEECINTASVDLSFSQDILKVVDFTPGDSILTLWIKQPDINDLENISFAGGIPGGYCGRLPGDPGESNLLGRIIFQVKEISGAQQAEIKFLDTSQILLNDGLGTPAELTVKGSNFIILLEGVEAPKREWQEELAKDKTPPEPFEIELNQDPTVFEGKYFIVFFTTDKQTGVEYYEVKEGEREWKKGKSPYLLEDQSLQSIIKVRAVDKAGSERIVEYMPPIAGKPFPWRQILLVLTGIGLIWWTIRKLKMKNEKLQFKI